MSKKNIDKLFQEKFKDFEEIPDDKVWDTISESLDRKKSRRLIPIWWKLGGVAALLAIVFTIVNPYETDVAPDPATTEVEKTDVAPLDKKEEGSKKILKEEIPEAVDEVADRDRAEPKTDSRSGENEDKHGLDSDVVEKKSNVPIDTKNDAVKETQLATSGLKKSFRETEAKSIKDDKPEVTEQLNEAIAKKNDQRSGKNAENKSENDRRDEKLNPTRSVEEGFAVAEEEKTPEEPIRDTEKKSIFEEVEKQQEDAEEVTEGSRGKWSVGANLAPVYFDSFGDGSPIDQSFSSNSKSGDVNFSYGLSVAYGLSNRLQLRTGINKVDYSYNTNEIEFSPSLEGAFTNRLSFVDYTPASENVIVESKKTATDFAVENAAAEGFSAKTPSTRSGTMAQEFGYIEIPVELDYALIDKRFGVNLVGGLSSMFLTNNSVALNSSNETVALGEANNLNDVNFSTNIGFGLNYRFTSKIRLNVEPIFKYQLNTFSDTAGSFNPFSIGVYSGLNFRF